MPGHGRRVHDMAVAVLQQMGQLPLVLPQGEPVLRLFMQEEVADLILFLKSMVDVRLFVDRTPAVVARPIQTRLDRSRPQRRHVLHHVFLAAIGQFVPEKMLSPSIQ